MYKKHHPLYGALGRYVAGAHLCVRCLGLLTIGAALLHAWSVQAEAGVQATNSLFLVLSPTNALQLVTPQPIAWGVVANGAGGAPASPLHLTNQVAQVQVLWSAATCELRGQARVRADDVHDIWLTQDVGPPSNTTVTAYLTLLNGYELSIEPDEGLVARPDDGYAHANNSAAPVSILYAPEIHGRRTRLRFSSGSSGTVRWRLQWRVREE